jgi:hypothetical protein
MKYCQAEEIQKTVRFVRDPRNDQETKELQERILSDYGYCCGYPAKHSVVFRSLEFNKRGKIVVRVCNQHFDKLHAWFDGGGCLFDSGSRSRINFRRNRL